MRTRRRSSTAKAIPAAQPCIGVPVATDGDIPKELGLDRAALDRGGLRGQGRPDARRTARRAPTLIAFGIGPRAEVDAAKLRDARGSVRARGEKQRARSRSCSATTFIATRSSQRKPSSKGAILARYHYLAQAHGEAPQVAPRAHPREHGDRAKISKRALELAGVFARAAELARDLAAAPALVADRAPHGGDRRVARDKSAASRSRSSTRSSCASWAAAACSASTPAASSRRA